MNAIATDAIDVVALDEESDSGCLPVGMRLAEFEIKGVIGEGGFGIVYLAFDDSLQRTVAIKEYMPAMLAGRADDESVVVRSKQHQETFGKGLRSFINEARLLAQFDHPALIKVYRFWEQNNTGYMAMRCYEGRTLKNIVDSEPAMVTEAWLKSILAPILEALEALYRVNVLHRDISPDNIMVQNNGQAVLLDFGSARQIISDMTQTMTVILKPGYAPVEQYADDELLTQGPWTDIYSLSAVMYFAILGKAPATSVGRMIKDPMTPLQNGLHPGFSREFLAAIDKGMAIRPEDRPQSIDEFRKLLGIERTSNAAADEALPMMPDAMRNISSAFSTAKRARKKRHAGDLLLRFVNEARSRRKMVMAGVSIALMAGIPLMLRWNVAHTSSMEPPAAATAPQEQILDDETIAWELLAENPRVTSGEIENYIHAYPAGKHIEQAKARIAELKAQDSLAAETASAPGAAPGTPLAEPPPTRVKLIIKPWGHVVVDDVPRGVSPPLKILRLSQGRHRIRINNPNFPAHIMNVDVKGEKSMKVEYDFSAARKGRK